MDMPPDGCGEFAISTTADLIMRMSGRPDESPDRLRLC